MTLSYNIDESWSSRLIKRPDSCLMYNNICIMWKVYIYIFTKKYIIIINPCVLCCFLNKCFIYIHVFSGRWKRGRLFEDKNSDSDFSSQWSSKPNEHLMKFRSKLRLFCCWVSFSHSLLIIFSEWVFNSKVCKFSSFSFPVCW